MSSTNDTQNKRPGWGSTTCLAGILCLLTIVAYFPALRGGFIWDDDDHLTRNAAVQSPSGLQQIWTSLEVSRYYPLTLTTFWVEHRIWGLKPWPYHAVNIALQAINAVVLWALLRRLGIRGAWLAALLWAVHPVNVETVAWVTELKNTQSGLFFLLALLLYLRFEDGLRQRDYAIVLLCGVAAMLSKPSTVVLPGVMLLCAWWRRGRWTRQDLLRVAPLAMLAVGMSLLTVLEQRHHIARETTSDWTMNPVQRLMLAGDATWFYAGKLLWPASLTFIYPRWELQTDSVVAWLPLAGAFAVAWMLWRFRRENWARAAIFGLGYFVIALLPVLGFFNIYFFRYSFVGDHFQYLASIGLVSLIVGGGEAICERGGRWGRDIGAVAATAVLFTLGFCTWKQTHVYHDVETLWRDTLSKNPDAWLAHNNLGFILEYSGRVDEAMQHYQEALRLKPGLVEAHNNMGIALSDMGRVTEGIEQYKEGLRMNPRSPEAHYNLGNALRSLGRPAEAVEEYGLALQYRPVYPEAHNNLGLALEDLGKATEAREHYETALRMRPDFAEAHNNLGNVEFGLGRFSEAVKQYEQALEIQPDYAEARNNLGNALSNLGRITEAIAQYEQALVLQPDYPEAHFNLGAALEQLGRIPEAVGHYEQALRLKPDFAAAWKRLVQLRGTR
jgi:protein O-mannosyl-transferase